MNKLNTGFSRLPNTEFDNKAEMIIIALTGNTAFPSPNPTPAIVQTKLDAYRAALSSTGTGRKQAVQSTRDDLSQTLERLARNLEQTPNVTDAQLATTGFDMRQKPSRSDLPVDAPGNVRLASTGTTGEVKVACNPVGRAKSYEAQYSQDPNAGPWTDAGTFPNTRAITISGLQRAKDYWVRVRAIGPNGAGAWGDPATILVT
jgi:hypothetical protein